LYATALAARQRALFAPELLLAKLAESRGFLLLALNARLFVVLAPPGLSKDSILLDTLVKALKGSFERFAIADDNFCQVR